MAHGCERISALTVFSTILDLVQVVRNLEQAVAGTRQVALHVSQVQEGLSNICRCLLKVAVECIEVMLWDNLSM
jgi:hypothetical protein